jgi:hypothetical protein
MFIVMALLLAIGPNNFTATLPISPELPEGQRLLAQRALEICAGRYPQLGRYRFEGTEQVTPGGGRTGSFSVEQELTCLDTPPPAAWPAEQPAPTDWQPSAADERQVTELTRRYFTLVDAGDAERVHQLWSAGNRAETPLPERAAAIREFRLQAGAPGPHRIAGLSWYVNPAGAPRPGVYVAADYERSYAGLAVNCGYLVWFREPDGNYSLIREENNSTARQEREPMPDQVEELRALMRCPAR